MLGFLSADSQLYTWVFLPLLIFMARILDVTLGTVRLIFISRGLKFLAPIAGFFEVLLWILVVGQIMQNLSNPACYVAYAGGFAAGNYIGLLVAEKLSLGVVLVRIVTQRPADVLLDRLRDAGYGGTSVDGHGRAGPVQLIFTIVPRREVANVVAIVKQFNPRAFYSIEEVGFVESGVLPLRPNWHSLGLLRQLRPFRKGK
jgi:uncharacterized protein YebE (UPF0316 family)